VLSAAVLLAVMSGCVIFKSVTPSQLNSVGNVQITTTACASDPNTNHTGYTTPDPACQGAGKGGNVDSQALNSTLSTPSFNHVTTGTKTDTTTTDPSFSYTINNGGDRLLVVKIVESATTDNIAGVTYGGTALTALSEFAPGAGRWANHVFYLKNPPTGTANVVVDITSGVKLTVGMEQYNGVNQTSTFGTVATASSQAGSTAPTVNVAGVSTDMITDSLSVVSNTTIPTVTTPAPQTEDYEINTGATTADVVGLGSHGASAGTSTTMSHTLSASRPWSTVGFGIKGSQKGSQMKLAYRIPSAVTAPASFVSTDPSGGSAITFTQNASYASALTALEVPGAGKKWVGYLSNVQSYTTSGYQYFTVAPQFPLPQASDGSPFQTPFNYRVVVGFRNVNESTTGATSSRTVTCGTDSKALYDDALATADPQIGICVDDPADISTDLSLATRDLGVVAGSPQAVNAGSQATVPFTLEYSGTSSPSFNLSGSSNLPGSPTVTPSQSSITPGSNSNTSITATVNVPPGTTPGTYNVTLTASGTGGAAGQNRSKVNTITVGEAFGLSPSPTLPALGTITLNAQAQIKNATMSNFGVLDSPGTVDQGWNVTVVGDTSGGKPGKLAQYCPGPANCGAHTPGYVSGGFQLLSSSLNLNTTGASWSGGSGTTPTFNCNAGNCPIDSVAATKIASAPNGGGTALWSATGFSSSSLRLSTPSTLRALPIGEVYFLHAVWTLNSGP